MFVPGNHDPEVSTARAHRSGQFLRAGLPCEPPRPAGCRSVDGTVLDVAGLRIAGLGGCVRYRPGPNQYSQREYHRRAARLLRRVGRPLLAWLGGLLTVWACQLDDGVEGVWIVDGQLAEHLAV